MLLLSSSAVHAARSLPASPPLQAPLLFFRGGRAHTAWGGGTWALGEPDAAKGEPDGTVRDDEQTRDCA